MKVEHSLARRGAEKLWQLVDEEEFVPCLGALTGGQAVQQVKAGVKAIYVSGWQVAADRNTSATMYPDQSLYAVDSVPTMARRINNALKRANQIQWQKGNGDTDFFAPIVADAGFGEVLNSYELMTHMIESGAAGVHYEDQMAAVKKCGHMGGKVLVPAQEAIQKLVAARLAADVAGVPAAVLTSDIDERTAEGFYVTNNGIEQAIDRGLFYAPYVDLLWCETAVRDLEGAQQFADAIRKDYPDQLLAYNCSLSFNWEKNLDEATIAKFQRELGAMGYRYQFVTLAGIHNMWYNMSDLANHCVADGMTAYVQMVQEREFAAADRGYTFASHRQEVGAGYFDDVTTVIQGGQSLVTALTGSIEEEQFKVKSVTGYTEYEAESG